MKKILESLALLALPALAFAQQQGEDAQTFFTNVKTNIVNPLIELLALAAFVVFVWGVVDFIRGADDAEKRATGQQHMIWGIVGLVIIFGTNAIINILKSTFGI
jgi:uncharacterized membrane protein YidH (DUF202 family)